MRLETGSSLYRTASLAALIATAIVAAGCGGGEESNSIQPVSPAAQPVGTGVLTITVKDPEGRPVRDARVSVFDRARPALAGSARTDSNGSATVGSLPEAVRFSVVHEFGSYTQEKVDVLQRGATSVGVTLSPRHPRPTLALLPVVLQGGSVNASRNEVTLQITVIASPSAPFVLSEFGDFSAIATPSLGLELGEGADGSRRECFVWLDQRRAVPSCGAPWGESPYTVSVEQFRYDAIGPAPPPASAASPRSTMLLIDQSRRVSTLDPGTFRSFAARRFIERIASLGGEILAIAGFAGTGGDPATPLSLPAQPLWTPSGAGTLFTTDVVALKSNVGILEPLVGGSAPLFDALEAAVGLTAASAPAGDRAVVALLGGGDDRELTASERGHALGALRRQRDDTGVRTILIDAAPTAALAEHRAIADLAAALRSTTISLGVSSDDLQFFTQTWASGSHAALDLAADLTAGVGLPTLSAVFRVRSDAAGAFPSGATLRGVLHLETEICPMGCWEVPLAFAVEIP